MVDCESADSTKAGRPFCLRTARPPRTNGPPGARRSRLPQAAVPRLRCPLPPKSRVGGTRRWRRVRRHTSAPQYASYQRLKCAESRNLAPGRTRWPNRDPIEEIGGMNLYIFVRNTPAVLDDLLGLATDAKQWCDCLSLQFERRWYERENWFRWGVFSQSIEPGTNIPAHDAGLYVTLVVNQDDKCQCIAAEVNNPKRSFLSKTVRMSSSYDAKYRGRRGMNVNYSIPHPGNPIGGGSHFPRPSIVPAVWPTDVIASAHISIILIAEDRICNTYTFPVKQR